MAKSKSGFFDILIPGMRRRAFKRGMRSAERGMRAKTEDENEEEGGN